MARDKGAEFGGSRGAGGGESRSVSDKPAHANPAYVNKRLRSASPSAGNSAGGASFPPPFPPPPPPPFGAYPPPPSPPFAPFGAYPPPPHFEYDEDGNLIEYVYDEDADGDYEEFDEALGENVEEVNEDISGTLGIPPVPRQVNFQPVEEFLETKGKSVSMDDKTILELQRKGFETAQKQALVDASQQRFRLVLNLFLILLVLCALTFGVYKFFDIFKPQRPPATYEVVERQAVSSWNLPEDKANDIVKAFYVSNGGISSTGRISNKVLTGSLHAGINVESFYCIQRGMRAYLKFNNPVYPKVFLLNIAGVAKQLASTSVTGDSTAVSESITLQLNGIVFFDELLHRAAFVDYGVNKKPYIYAGSQDLDGEVCDIIEMRPEKNIKISYFFSRKTKRIVQKDIDFSGVKATVQYSDYAEFADGVFYPKNRTIYVNKNLFGNVVIDTVRFNQDVIFPR